LKANPTCRYKSPGGSAPARFGAAGEERRPSRGGRKKGEKKEFSMTESVVRVCAQAEVAPDSVAAFEVGDRRLAVFNLGGEYYVTDDECTHAAASLADGMLEDGVIECSMHFGAFDVKTGEVKAPPCSLALRTYKVLLQGDDVLVDLDKNAAGEPA
jgi:nitrite reductase/ring-hydroxylating ferredoxin subunit